ncbi:MAG TPA: hypothetical protein VFO46_03510 [Candidatus Sulfotelmatobacter sp.]|nr:hypothetical protein [Candidatus Sulfotelmatobacter sp.]
MVSLKLQADFNGLFSKLLCLSHKDTALDEYGNTVNLVEGMQVTAFEENYEDGKRDDLIASGTVQRSPDWLQCRGSRWALRIDENGVRTESDLRSSSVS